MQANEQKLRRTLSEVFGVPEGSIDAGSSKDTIPGWDSLKHLNLVLAIEEQFAVSLTEEQSLEIMSFSLIKEVLGEHGVSFPKDER